MYLNRRYPRPLWFRLFRRLLIWWWFLPALCLAFYVIGLVLYVQPANYFHTLLDHLHFLTQSWWTILPSVITLIGMGVLLFASYRWADDDYWNELREEQQRREQQSLPPPPGFKLRSTLRGHGDIIWQIAWAPDGRTLASGSSDNTIRLWDVEAAQVCRPKYL